LRAVADTRRHDAVERVVHFIGCDHGLCGVGKHGHQAIAQGLDDHATRGGHDLRDQRDAACDHRGGLGVAQGFVQRGAAAQVGKQYGSLKNLRHVVKFMATNMKKAPVI